MKNEYLSTWINISIFIQIIFLTIMYLMIISALYLLVFESDYLQLLSILIYIFLIIQENVVIKILKEKKVSIKNLKLTEENQEK